MLQNYVTKKIENSFEKFFYFVIAYFFFFFKHYSKIPKLKGLG
jgi:hypothetical protein